MNDAERIRAALERNRNATAKRPSIAQGTAVTRARMVDGLTCELEDGPWKLTVDMAERHGGNNQGPNPGVLGRGALASCLMIAIQYWAARAEVPISGLEVEVHADYDVRGQYGTADVSPAYTQIRYVITIESEASEAEIQQALADAEAHCPYLHIFADPMDLRRELKVVTPRS